MLNIRTLLNVNIITHFQSQIYQADEIMKELQPGDVHHCAENITVTVKGALNDIDEKFMQHNGISKICGEKCRTDLEQSIENIHVAIEGALYDIDEKLMQHDGISNLVNVTSK